MRITLFYFFGHFWLLCSLSGVLSKRHPITFTLDQTTVSMNSETGTVLHVDSSSGLIHRHLLRTESENSIEPENVKMGGIGGLRCKY